MSREPDSESGGRKPLGSDLIIPVAAIVFTLYYFHSIIHTPWTAQVSAFFSGSILLILCTAFTVGVSVKVLRGHASLRFDTLLAPVDIAPRRALLFVLTVAYIFCIDWAGFTITTFIFLVLAMSLLSGRGRRNRLLIVLLSASLAIGGYLLFVVAFERHFPEGPFERAFKATLNAMGGG